MQQTRRQQWHASGEQALASKDIPGWRPGHRPDLADENEPISEAAGNTGPLVVALHAKAAH